MNDVDMDIELPQLTEQERAEALYGPAVVAANKLAGTLVDARKFRGAKIALCRALTAAPTHHELWANLSSVMYSLRAFEDAQMCATNSLQLNPNLDPGSTASAYVALGNACVSLGEHYRGLDCFNTVIEQYSRNEILDEADGSIPEIVLDARWNRSLLLLLLGQYREGWTDYHIRIDRDKKEHEKDKRYSSPMWEGEDLKEKSLLLLHDQGYGDTIMYSRYIPAIAREVGKLYISIAPPLVPLFQGFKELGNIEFLHYGERLPKVDYHTYLGSLPYILEDGGYISGESYPKSVVGAQDFILPYVQRDLEDPGSRITIQEPAASPVLKVGVCWSGRPDFARNDERAVPLRLIASLAESPAFWLYSFQMGAPSRELYDLGVEPFVFDLDKEMNAKGWIGTATAMLQMDVIVTCCTSIAHLAGTLGVPCWVLLHTEPYWPWGAEGATTPWYPSIRLFRQLRERRGDWTCVVEEVRSELYNLLKQKAQAQAQPEVR